MEKRATDNQAFLSDHGGGGNARCDVLGRYHLTISPLLHLK